MHHNNICPPLSHNGASSHLLSGANSQPHGFELSWGAGSGLTLLSFPFFPLMIDLLGWGSEKGIRETSTLTSFCHFSPCYARTQKTGKEFGAKHTCFFVRRHSKMYTWGKEANKKKKSLDVPTQIKVGILEV